MHNWYSIETEVEFRRQEWQRMVEADVRAALADTGPGERGHWRVPHGFLARLRALRAPRWPFSPPAETRRPAVYSAK